MMQAETAWRNVEGADCISSEDESWLNHPGFHLSDSEEDELQSVGVQYVHAVTAIKRASLQSSKLELYGQTQPLLLEAAAREAASEGNNNFITLPSTSVQADKQGHTMHALELVLPQEPQVTHLATQTTPVDTLLASSGLHAAVTATHKNIPTSASPLTILQKPDLAYASPSVATSSQQQQQLPSPASNVAAKPFPGPPPVAPAQQQAPQQPLRQGQHSERHQPKDLAAAAAAAATPTPVGLLELSLSADQIALLQAAADNAQSYLDKDAASIDENTEQVQGTSSGPKADGDISQHAACWDMQSAIVEAFKSILPADSSSTAAPSAAASASAQGSALPADMNLTPVAPPVPTQPLQGQTEKHPTQAQANVLQHPMSEDAVAKQRRAGPQFLSSCMPPARPQHAKAFAADSAPADVPISRASLTALPRVLAQPLPDQVQTSQVSGKPASEQSQAPRDPPQNLPQGSKLLHPPPAVGTPDAVAFSNDALPSKRSPISTGSEAGMSPAPPTTAEADMATADAAGLKTATATAPAARPAAPPSAAAEPVAAAAASSQTPLDTLGSKQEAITASINIPMSSYAVTPELASVAANRTAATQPVPLSLDQASHVTRSTDPQSAVVPMSNASLTAGVVSPEPPATIHPLRTPVDPGQAASVPLSKGVSAPSGGETKGAPLVLSASTASGTASQGSISATAPLPPATAAILPSAAATPSATAATPAATAAIPPATAAMPPATAAIPPATAAIPPATAATPPAMALTASVSAASQSRSDQPSAGLGTAAQGPLQRSPRGVKVDSQAAGSAAKEGMHSTAPGTVMVTQSLAALNPPVALNSQRGQAPQLPASLTAAVQTSTVPSLLPPRLSPRASPLCVPAFSLFPRDLSEMPQLPVNLTPSATAHAVCGTAGTVGVAPNVNPSLPQTLLVAPPIPSAAAAERPFQFPANPAASSPAPANLTPSASQGFAGIPVSPSLFSPAQAAGPAKNKSGKASKKRKAEQQAVPSSARPEYGAKQPPASAGKKRKAERQGIPSPVPPQSSAKQPPAATVPAAAALSGPPSCTADSASKQPSNALSPKRHQSGLNTASFDFVSPELNAMRNAHGNCPLPMVGAHAVQSQLADVKSLVTDSTHKYSLKDIINTIGEFAVGRQQRQEIFLGDLHNSRFHQQQILSIASLFGVRARMSSNADRFHEKFRLTELVAQANAGILTRHGDMLMYYIVELAELSKLNKQQGGDIYKKEEKATLELANAVGRKLKGANGNSKALNKGCQIRLQQLADKGYLAVKRSKQGIHHINPARYSGWRGRPRYGPTINFPLPPAAKATAAPHKPKPVKASLSESKYTPPAAAPTASPSLQTSQDLLSKPARAAAKQTQPTAAGPLPPSSQTSTPTPQTAPISAAAAALALSPLVSLPQATATAKTQLPESSSGHSQQQQQQPPMSGTTSALVAAVGPLFEMFVAQTAAVATDPSVSLQTLTGAITQQLATAIANAAVQVVAQRRQQLAPIAGCSSTDVPLSQAAALTTPTSALAPAERCEPAVAGSTPVDHVSGSSNLCVDTSKEAKSVAIRHSKKGQVQCDDGVQSTDEAAAQNDGFSMVAFTGSAGAHGKHIAASSDVAATPEVDQGRKRVSSNANDQHSSGHKRQKKMTAGPSIKDGVKSQDRVEPLKKASRSDTSTSDRAQRGSGGTLAKSHRGSGRGSPGLRGSRGSGRSSPKEMGAFDAASHEPACAQPVCRNNLSPAFRHAYGAGPSLLPSRLSGHGAAGSPMTSVPLSFVPNASGQLDFRPSNGFTDVMLSPQAELAHRFVPLMPPSPGEWHMHPPALNNFPMAAHFLPGVDEAPDFSPVN